MLRRFSAPRQASRTPDRRTRRGPARRLLARAALAAGAGRWYGAFVCDRFVADLGILVGDGQGRFQDVKTHPDHRRQGICRRLVLESSRDALLDLGAGRLVIVARRGSPAARVHASVVFAESEQQAGAFRPPPDVLRERRAEQGL